MNDQPRSMADLIRYLDPNPPLLNDTDRDLPELAEALAQVGRMYVWVDLRPGFQAIPVVYEAVRDAEGRLLVRCQAFLARRAYQGYRGDIRLHPQAEARRLGARIADEVPAPDLGPLPARQQPTPAPGGQFVVVEVDADRMPTGPE